VIVGTNSNVEPFARTLEHQLALLLRGASLECLVCGEFVMHAREGVVFCPECGAQAGQESALLAEGELESVVQAG
jgi:uncharacterized Zn finger protein (UPF0148 family)